MEKGTGVLFIFSLIFSLVLDFRSIELRLLSHFSNDESLSSIISVATGVDVFVSLASQWYGFVMLLARGPPLTEISLCLISVLIGLKFLTGLGGSKQVTFISILWVKV